MTIIMIEPKALLFYMLYARPSHPNVLLVYGVMKYG